MTTSCHITWNKEETRDYSNEHKEESLTESESRESEVDIKASLCRQCDRTGTVFPSRKCTVYQGLFVRCEVIIPHWELYLFACPSRHPITHTSSPMFSDWLFFCAEWYGGCRLFESRVPYWCRLEKREGGFPNSVAAQGDVCWAQLPRSGFKRMLNKVVAAPTSLSRMLICCIGT